MVTQHGVHYGEYYYTNLIRRKQATLEEVALAAKTFLPLAVSILVNKLD